MDRRQGEPWYAEVRPLLDADEVEATDERGDGHELLAILPMYFHRWDETAQALHRLTAHRRRLPFTRRAGAGRGGGHMDLRPELGRIAAPTLVVVGEDDFICDVVPRPARWRRPSPAHELATIPDAGHFPWVEQPAAFRAGRRTVPDIGLTGSASTMGRMGQTTRIATPTATPDAYLATPAKPARTTGSWRSTPGGA